MTLTLLVAAWLAGLLLGLKLNVTPLPILLLALAMLSLSGLLGLIGRAAIPAVLAGVLLLGLLRVEASGDPLSGLVLLERQQAAVRGADRRRPRIHSSPVQVRPGGGCRRPGHGLAAPNGQSPYLRRSTSFSGFGA